MIAKTQGQWAKGETEPLNENEVIKLQDDGLNVRRRIEEDYAPNPGGPIDPLDRNVRFRWWGLYTQRAPGIKAEDLARASAEELADDCFMLRIRVDGGRLNVAQLQTIAEISVKYARNTADITDRQNIQLHWVYVQDLPEIWRRLEEVGLTTIESAGDVPRVVVSAPLGGISTTEIIDPSPALDDVKKRLLGNPAFSNLPRKFKSAISGEQDIAHEINDVSFVGVIHPESGPGFDVWVGGGLATNPMLAQRLGVWVPSAEVGQVWQGIVELFRDYGYRKSRTKSRLKYLVKDLGVTEFRRILETQYLGRALADGPAVILQDYPTDHIGLSAQNDGNYTIGLAPIAGRVSGAKLAQIAQVAKAVGSDRIRLTPLQKILLLDVAPSQVAEAQSALSEAGFPVNPSFWRRSIMACTGSEFCKFGLVNTKDRAAELICELEERLASVAAQLENPISIHLNGCPNSCARIQVADIGLKGMVVKLDSGEYVPAFQVHLGGRLGADATFGRKVRGHRVLGQDLGDYIERIVRNYVVHRVKGQSFSAWVQACQEELLMA